MKKNLVLSAIAVGSLLSVSSIAQDSGTDTHVITVKVPAVALLDLESSSSLNFDAEFTQETPLEAGEKITAPTDNSTVWLNYSSILSDGGASSRHVDVKASEVVPGIDMKVTAAAATGGYGTKGTPASQVTLTAADQEIITGIGSAYTETGASKGHKLTYNFTAPDADYGDLVSKDYAVTVTYTLADD